MTSSKAEFHCACEMKSMDAGMFDIAGSLNPFACQGLDLNMTSAVCNNLLLGCKTVCL